MGVKPNTWKSYELESSGTPECLELNSKGQNTSHWDAFDVIEKVLKRRYRKWHRIGHLDICSPSYGQKKGRESNWQFDSRPLKVENRPFPDIRFECATWRWKDLDEGYNFCLDLVAIGLYSRESQEFVRFGYSLHGKLQRILYGGRWWLPPSSGRVESCVSKCPWLVPTPKGVLNAKLTSRGWFLDADSHKVS